MRALKFIYILPFVFTFLVGCKSSEDAEIATNTEESGPEDSVVVNAPGGDESEEKTLFASIERGACYGSCPTYKMYIYSDGSMTLKGIRAIDSIGSFTGSVTSAQMQELIDTANRIGYMELEDRYDGNITDLPGTKTSIVIGDVEKEVYRRFNYPKRILNFEKLFDEIMNSTEWVRVEE